MILENTSKRMLVFNLDHPDVLKAAGEHGGQQIKTVTVDHLPTGELISRSESKRVPSSLTLLAGEKRSGLPDVVAQCEQIKVAIAAGDVRVVEQAEEPKEHAQ